MRKHLNFAEYATLRGCLRQPNKMLMYEKLVESEAIAGLSSEKPALRPEGSPFRGYPQDECREVSRLQQSMGIYKVTFTLAHEGRGTPAHF
jgi:hypothetical protein